VQQSGKKLPDLVGVSRPGGYGGVAEKVRARRLAGQRVAAISREFSLKYVLDAKQRNPQVDVEIGVTNFPKTIDFGGQ